MIFLVLKKCLSLYCYIQSYVLGVIHKLRHALGGGGVNEFVTDQIQNFLLFGKFVKREEEGSKKSFFA